MTRPAKAPWLLARIAQGAIAAVAVSDVFRELAVRAHHLHPTDASLRKSGFTSMIFAYLMTVALVLFLVWLGRCRRNAEVLSPGTATVSGVWAVMAWLIPVINWWVPRRFVLDIQRASTDTPEKGHTTALVNTWWAAWVAHMAVSVVGLRTSQEGAMTYLVVSEALNITAAVLAICVINRITALQRAAIPTMATVKGRSLALEGEA